MWRVLCTGCRALKAPSEWEGAIWAYLSHAFGSEQKQLHKNLMTLTGGDLLVAVQFYDFEVIFCNRTALAFCAKWLCSLAARLGAVKIPILTTPGVIIISLFRRSVPAKF